MATALATRTAREYLRVSKGKGRGARSITDQHRDNIASEQDHGPWTWGEAYADTGSASKYARKSRDDFDRLTADLESGAFGKPGDILVLWEISRLARETGKGVRLIDLCEAGGYLIHITSHERTYNPANYQDRHDLISGINDAEKEVRLLSKRTRRGTDSALAEGKFHGKRPFGYARRYEVIDGRSRPVEQYPDPVEAPLVVELFERVAGWNGRTRESIRAVSVDWEARGIVSRQGGVPFSPRTLRTMLVQRLYLGERMHEGKPRPGNWKAIIDRALFDTVQAIIADPTRKTHTSNAVRHVLTGPRGLLCAVCGSHTAARAYDSGTEAYTCYRASHVRIPKAETDAFLIGELDRVDPETGEPLPPKLGLILEYLSREDVAGQLAPDADGSELTTVRAALASKRAELEEMEAAPRPSTARAKLAMISSMEELEDEITDLEKRESALLMPDPLSQLIETGPGIVERWTATPVTAQRAIAAILFAGPLGQPRIKRVADSESDAVGDRIAFA
ncbi:recombinase family protein [Streptomyces sp. NPDC001928]|uniref:recombinase family protein n=1 Tax=Streptomyces sp. NPDC001928 TaxID=3154404 RepID=UPI00331D4C98